MLTNWEEAYVASLFVFEFPKINGRWAHVRDAQIHFEKKKIMIARERLDVVVGMGKDAIVITNRKTTTDYDVTLMMAVAISDPAIQQPSQQPTQRQKQQQLLSKTTNTKGGVASVSGSNEGADVVPTTLKQEHV